MKYKIAIMVMMFVTCSLYGANANARCYVGTPLEALNGAKVVFVGKVISVTDPGLPPEGIQFRTINLVRPVRIRLLVEKIYRGKKVREIELVTNTGGFESGFEFKVGETYLVYGQENEANEQGLIVMGCGRTRLTRDAKEDLKLLDALSKRRHSKSR